MGPVNRSTLIGQSVNIDRSTVNTGRVQTRPVGPGYGLGFGPPCGMLWRCHVVAKGLHWASSTVLPTPRGSWWTGVHGPWTVGWVFGGPSLSFFPLAWSMCTGCRCVRPVRGILCFLPRHAPAGGVLTGELLQRRWRPIEVGKSIARPWRVRWWGQGGGQSFLGLWPRWSAAWRGGYRRWGI